MNLGHSINLVADGFELAGNPYVTVEVLAIIAVVAWRGNFSHLALALTLPADPTAGRRGADLHTL